jgi:hypothetical protein
VRRAIGGLKPVQIDQRGMIPIENFLEIQSALTVLSFEVRQSTE